MGTLAERLEQRKNPDFYRSSNREIVEDAALAARDEHLELKKNVQERLIDSFNEAQLTEENSRQNRARILEKIRDFMDAEGAILSTRDESRISQEIYDEVMGLGPIEPLLRDTAVSEIMVINASQVYIEKKGRLLLSEVKFENDAHIMKIIDRIVSKVGRRCDESNPMVDARLPDGSRVNAVIPPIALKGPCLTIRKFSSTPLGVMDLIEKDSLSREMSMFLEACVKGKCNIVVAGGTGSGKTTLLNVLSSFIGSDERIVTIEDAAELQLMQQHVVTLEARPANIEGKGKVAIRDLVVNALRMRPDRIVVGEVRSSEALDMLQAMNTGHDGSMTTVHANTPRDVLSRLETMVMMSGMELPSKAIREQVCSAIHIIVQQARLRDGSRKITNVTEVLGMEGDTIVLQDIFTFVQEGVDAAGRIRGRFTGAGILPRISARLEEEGVAFSERWFQGNL